MIIPCYRIALKGVALTVFMFATLGSAQAQVESQVTPGNEDCWGLLGQSECDTGLSGSGSGANTGSSGSADYDEMLRRHDAERRALDADRRAARENYQRERQAIQDEYQSNQRAIMEQHERESRALQNEIAAERRKLEEMKRKLEEEERRVAEPTDDGTTLPYLLLDEGEAELRPPTGADFFRN
jgi:ribosomal protein S17E